MSDPANTRILVTGGTGFIGRYVVDLLSAEGFNPLVTTFNEPTPNSGHINLNLTDSKQCSELVQNYKPQIVLHLAGVTGNTDPTGKIYNDVNFTGTVNLINACHKIGVTRMVLLGTAAEYGNQPTPFREDMPAQPVSHYAVSKAKVNQFALDLYVKNDFPVTILRIFTAYGYGQPDKMFLSQLITHGLLNKHFMMSDGLQKRDFVYIEDVAKAMKLAMAAENAVGSIINIAGGKGVALRDVAKKVWEMCGADEKLLDVGSREKSGDDSFDTEADISMAKKILNWEPGSGILDEAGERLRETIQKTKGSFAAE